MQVQPRRAAAPMTLALFAVAAGAGACGPDRDVGDRPFGTGDPAAADTPAAPRPPVTNRPPPPAPGTALAGYDFSVDPGPGVPLPRGLGEVSGLAVDGLGRLYAHGDELAVVFVIDPATGEFGDRFGAGRPVLRADFEGIAVAEGRVWLVDSDGTLVSMPPGRNDAIVPHRVVRTGLGTICEVEGLGRDPIWGVLLMACKEARTEDARGRLRVHHVSVSSAALDERPVLDMPLAELNALDLEAALRPSAIELHPFADSYLVLSAAEGVLVEIGRAGHPVAAVKLPEDLLPQPEGLAVTPDGTLWVATEGRGGPGRLFRWPWTSPRPDRP